MPLKRRSSSSAFADLHAALMEVLRLWILVKIFGRQASEVPPKDPEPSGSEARGSFFVVVL